MSTNETAARFVATHWRDAILRLPPEDICRAYSHPLAMVLAALDGETDPLQLGIEPYAHKAFNDALARETLRERQRRALSTEEVLRQAMAAISVRLVSADGAHVFNSETALADLAHSIDVRRG